MLKIKLLQRIGVAIGDISSVRIHPREVFTDTVRRSAASVIFLHNHPSGDPTPSKEDMDITARLKDASDIGVSFFFTNTRRALL